MPKIKIGQPTSVAKMRRILARKVEELSEMSRKADRRRYDELDWEIWCLEQAIERGKPAVRVSVER